MSVVREQHGNYKIQSTGAIESIAQDKPKATFRKLWIYPGLPANGELVANAAVVKLGKDGDGPKVVVDSLNPNDPPILYELPEGSGETMHVSDILIKGTAGDGVFFSYWP